ncbi:MAG: hypothetical protein Q9187_001866 [Circinaria calcarea]
MSLFSRQGAALPAAIDGTAEQAAGLAIDSVGFMGDRVARHDLSFPRALDPHLDARAIVRLVQCSQCSLPLRTPMTLPCGNSLCRPCLPELHRRENISYPSTPGRQQGFTCPFKDCGREHALGDCSQDVTLAKIMERIGMEIAKYRPITSDTPMLLDERLRWKNIVDSSKEGDLPNSRILHGGRLVATYTMAELGELRFDSEVSYQTMSRTGDTYPHLDTAILDHLKEATRSEMDCHVCYALILDPLTTPCGHTFCRKCVARVLDHSNLCPICRRLLLMPPGVQSVPSNKRLSNLLLKLCPDHVAARADAATQEESGMVGEQNMPLFVVTLAYPSMPTFLHVFEPRYRLMIRRAIESGDRKFGMMMYNRTGEPQGELGPTPFMQYGTLLHIISMQLMPDGRSLIETVGISRFKVHSWSMLDGYFVGNIERVDDLSLAEEEHDEAMEVSSNPPANDLIAQLNGLSTRELLQIGVGFITRMRAASAPWLRETVIATYGAPPEDPALFPYWFASVVPISDDEKYQLLPSRSVRERLKITAQWVRRIEAQRCLTMMRSRRDGLVSPDSDSDIDGDDEHERMAELFANTSSRNED